MIISTYQSSNVFKHDLSSNKKSNITYNKYYTDGAIVHLILCG